MWERNARTGKRTKRGTVTGQKWRVQRTRRCPSGGKGLYFMDVVPDYPYNDDDS